MWRSVRLEEGSDVDEGDKRNADVEFRELLSGLQEKSRVIFQLYFGEQFTTKEIAEIMDMKENTVKSRLRRGKNSFVWNCSKKEE